MIKRLYVEKKDKVASEAKGLLSEINTFLGIKSLEKVRILNRYDIENIDDELFEKCVNTVFSEPQLDIVYMNPDMNGIVFAVEALPGQYDQRADSAAQCVQIISQKNRPLVKCAKVYVLQGSITEEEVARIKAHVINPVETREASLEIPETLVVNYDIPEDVEILEGFIDKDDDALAAFIADNGLAMDLGDIKLCREYFRGEDRNPTITEIKMIDTYWSDHCRHTTFNTIIDSVEFEDSYLQKEYDEYIKIREKLNRTKPVTLMDLGTIAAGYLKAAGKMTGLDESDEINACTVKIKVNIEGEAEDWLLLFKNETHNHPTEIEPFGGAATCIGGAIRDPLSGRSYIYTAMRLTGAADPLAPLEDTMKGKLPQRKIVTSAADGYSSYGNQIGVATGQVDEIYHPGYAAKRMEVGAVIGAAPAENVVREKPADGDYIILLGGRTGRDGCGGATGSSKSHDITSLENCGAEVQKGNAPEERKLQRLFRNPTASKMIRKCNDFGAGGVSVAIGELADGLQINLDKVPKKYDGLDGTELAISESQERMAVVISPENVENFCAIAAAENLEATIVARVTEEPRLVMSWRGKTIVDISREFLDSNGAEKHITVKACSGEFDPAGGACCGDDICSADDFVCRYMALADGLNTCSRRGLAEKFDSTIGAGTVLMPFGGKYQLTPSQTMCQKISVEDRNTTTCSLMSWGYNPYIADKSPYHGAYLAVVESVCKLIASGGYSEAIYLSFQEYFEKLGQDPSKWGKPMSALLGALKAQIGLETAAIGGKDSMSGTFENLNVPPTLISFAVTTAEADQIISDEFKDAGHKVVLLKPETDETGLPTTESLKKNFDIIRELAGRGLIISAYTPGFGGIAEAVMKMCLGNKIGFAYDEVIDINEIFGYAYGAFVLELAEGNDYECGSEFCSAEAAGGMTLLGHTVYEPEISFGSRKVAIEDILVPYENKLESVYRCNIEQPEQNIPNADYKDGMKISVPHIKAAKPKVIIPVFPGTNCEYDSAKAFAAAGAETETIVIRNLNAADITESVDRFACAAKNAQIIFIPGGFSGGDEPDGSGKFITAFFRNPAITDAVTEMMDVRGGLMAGICNGFQALIKLGLVPYGKIIDTDENCPTLALNEIGRHQSKLVNVRVASNLSPWLAKANVGDIYTIPVSHGEGRILADTELMNKFAATGQLATQYVDLEGNPTTDIQYNPNGSVYSVEGMTSPDGRIFGKMGHAERKGYGLYKNVPGEHDMKMFEAAVEFFR